MARLLRVVRWRLIRSDCTDYDVGIASSLLSDRSDYYIQ